MLKILVLMLLGVAMIAAACGGDDDDGDSDDNDNGDSNDNAPAEMEPSDGDDDGDDDGGDNGGDNDGGDGDGDNDRDRDNDADNDGDNDGDNGGDNGDGDNDGDLGLNVFDEDCRFVLAGGSDFANPLAAGAGDFDAVADVWQQIADRAPDEIKGEMQILADALTEFANILSGIDLTDPSALTDPDTQAAFANLEDAVDTERLEQATDAVNAWFEENCAA